MTFILEKMKNKKIDILMIDNYDSFTFNLVQYLGILGENIKVRRNDRISIDEIKEMSPSKIVISPGPGKPDEAGISKKVIEYFLQGYPDTWRLSWPSMYCRSFWSQYNKLRDCRSWKDINGLS
jgi:hypothetical protein